MHDLYYFIPLTLIYTLLSPQWLIVQLLTTDNIFLAYNTLCRVYKKPNYKCCFYEGPYEERYIYYFLLVLISPLLHLLFYTQQAQLLSITLYFSAAPPIYKLLQPKLECIHTFVKKYICKCYTFLYQHLCCYIINQLCWRVIHYHPNLTIVDVKMILKTANREAFNTLIKNFVILVVMRSISENYKMSWSLLTRMYNINTSYTSYKYVDPYPHIIGDENKIKLLLHRRNYQILLNPYVINVMMRLYEKQESHLPYYFIHKFEKSLIKTFTILTIINLLKLYSLDNHYVIVLVSITLIKSLTIKGVFLRIFGAFLGYLCQSYTIGVVFCEFHEWLLHDVAIWLIKQVVNWCSKRLYLLCHFNNDNLLLFFHFCYFSYVAFHGVDVFAVALLIAISQQPLMTGYFAIFGYFSHYSVLHLCVLVILYYLLVNLMYVKLAPRLEIKKQIINDYKPPLKLLEYRKPIVNTVVKQQMIIKSDYKPQPLLVIQGDVLTMMRNPKFSLIPY